MRPYPGRKWRMREILRYVEITRNCGADRKRKKAIRIGVGRVMDVLVEHGIVTRTPPKGAGSFALYAWKPECHIE